MRKALVLALGAALTVVPAAVSTVSASAAKGPPPLTLAVYGDAPYGTSNSDTAEFAATPAFIDSVNAATDVSLVAHVGDIHSGKQFCTQGYDESIANLWTGYQDPLVYTPGDNEWADCHKKGEGGGTWNGSQIVYVKNADGTLADYAGGDPLANLDLVRSIFFPSPGHTLGGGQLTVTSQAQAYDPLHPEDAQFVENVRWEAGGALFVTLNIPGGSNNDADNWYGAPRTQAQTDEIAARSAADLRWLDAAFTQATADGAASVVILEQADMWDTDNKVTTDGSPDIAHLTNYHQFVDSIASHTTAFAKPVLLINGDSHVYRSDNPLDPSAPCTTEVSGGEGPCTSVSFVQADGTGSYHVTNFHRIVVHGSTFPLEWLKLAINTSQSNAPGSNAFGPFRWERETQS